MSPSTRRAQAAGGTLARADARAGRGRITARRREADRIVGRGAGEPRIRAHAVCLGARRAGKGETGPRGRRPTAPTLLRWGATHDTTRHNVLIGVTLPVTAAAQPNENII